MFPVSPQVFYRVQLRSIGWQKLQLQASLQAGHVLPNQCAAVSPQAVPDYQQLAFDMAQQVFEKLNYLRPPNRSGKQTKVKMPPTHPGNSRKPFPVEMILQHRGLPTGSPRPIAIGPFRYPAFIDKHYGLPPRGSVFFNVGQRLRFQWRIFSSSFSKACDLGRWQLQPNCRRILQTWATWKRTPLISSISFPTLAAVHRLVLYPSSSGPFFRRCSSFLKSRAQSFDFRPARPAFLSPVRPASFRVSHHRLTDCRLTLSSLAMAAWLSPFSYSRAASIRRFSNASKSLLTPRGFPMQQRLSYLIGNVTIFYNA